MKRTTLFSLAIVALVAWSCGTSPSAIHQQEEQELAEKAALIASVITTADTAECPIEAIDRIPGFRPMQDSLLRGRHGRSVFYLLNSGCSVCIADLLRFRQVIDTTGLDIPVYVIPTSRNHVPTIEYYLDQPEDKAVKTQITVVKHTLPGEQISTLNKTVLVTYEDKIVSSLQFE